jgi:hypothetical protein
MDRKGAETWNTIAHCYSPSKFDLVGAKLIGRSDGVKAREHLVATSQQSHCSK